MIHLQVNKFLITYAGELSKIIAISAWATCRERLWIFHATFVSSLFRMPTFRLTYELQPTCVMQS